MAYKDKLLEKSEDENLLFLKILQKYKFDDNSLHYVFEGYADQSFYVNYLSKNNSQSYKYVSFGKNNSYNVHKLLNWSTYQKSRILFFVDKDLSDFLDENWPADDNIFVTKYYSIENYIPTCILLERVIREIFHCNEEDIIKEVSDKYLKAYAKFESLFIPIISWILFLKESKVKVNLNNIHVEKIFKIQGTLDFDWVSKNRLGYLEKVTSVQIQKYSIGRLRFWISRLSACNQPKLFLRGKFELSFFVSFCLAVEKFLKTKGIEPKTATNMNETNSIEILGPRVSMPGELDRFIDLIQSN